VALALKNCRASLVFKLFSAPHQSWETLLQETRQSDGSSQLELVLKTAKGTDLFLEGNLSARKRQGNPEAYRGIFSRYFSPQTG
jgi:hypothetical protein